MLDRFKDICDRAGKSDRLDRFNRRLAGSAKARLDFRFPPVFLAMHVHTCTHGYYVRAKSRGNPTVSGK